MTAHFVNGFIITAVALALTACGGSTTTQQMPGAGASQLITAPALDTGADNETADSNNVEPAPVGTTVESPPTDLPATDSVPADTGIVDTGVSDEVLLSGASGVGCDADAAVFNPTMLALINASRIEARMCGANLRTPVPTLQWNDKLTAAAAMHGNDMTSNNFFSHTGSDGLGVGDRATAAAYNWRAVGENIAAGQVDQAEVHQGWLDSEGHCVNIMNQSFTEVGAACITDSSSDFGTYWVVVFGDSK